MIINVRIKGLKEMKMKIKGLNLAAEEEMQDAMVTSGMELREKIISSMRETPRDASKKYKRGKKTHSPSRPGNPPAIDTGALVGSIVADNRKREVEVGSSISVIRRKMKNKTKGTPNYPIFLEEGTTKMEARPWLEPAKQDYKDKFFENIKKAVERAMKRP